jgi:hypothetical protein
MSMPDPLQLLAAQIVLSFLTFGLAAKRLARPLEAMPREHALELLLWPHAFRYLPLGLLAPAQSSREVPLKVLGTIAVGDLASSLIALAALVMLLSRARTAVGWVVAFSLVSVIDIGTALTVGLGHHVYRYPLGVGWYVLTLYVPLVCISQAMILITLLKKRSVSMTDASGFVREELR